MTGKGAATCGDARAAYRSRTDDLRITSAIPTRLWPAATYLIMRLTCDYYCTHLQCYAPVFNVLCPWRVPERPRHPLCVVSRIRASDIAGSLMQRP